MVCSIATQHGGHLQIESEEGVGSTFAIYLPKQGRQTPIEEETEEAADLAIDAMLTIEGSASLADRLLLPGPSGTQS